MGLHPAANSIHQQPISQNRGGRFMWKAPAVLIVAIAGLAGIGSSYAYYPVQIETQCAFAIARAKTPAPDVLLFGSSRTGRGLDPLYIERQLAASGVKANVERLVSTGPEIGTSIILAREFVRHHGAPKVAIVEIIYNRRPDEQDKISEPVSSPRNVMMANMADLKAAREATFPDQPLNNARIALRDSITKLTSNVFSGLMFLSHRVTGSRPKELCTGENMYRQTGIWPYGDLPGDPINPTWRLPGTAEDWKAEAAEYFPIAPAAPFRATQTRQIKEVVTVFAEAGSNVVMIIYPTIGEDLDQKTSQELQTIFADQKIIDMVTPFNAVTRGRENDVFADPTHVGPKGAIILSDLMAEKIPRLLAEAKPDFSGT